VKKLAIVLTSIVVVLIIALAVCVGILQQTKSELATTRAELKIREDVWYKLRSLSMTYHNGLKMSVPDFYNEGAPRPIVVRSDDWQSEAKYEFSSDGKSARVFVWGKEADWSFKPTASR
jgi:hypothetical protein